MKNENIEICDVSTIHNDIIKKVSQNMPDENDLSDLADFFKVFSDSTRMRIIAALSNCEMCVCDIAALLNMTQSSISHQLRILKTNRFVKNRRDGKVIYYSLLDEHIADILNQGLIHIKE